MYAIVKTGGKQYKVAAGDKLNIEKLNAEIGDEVALETLMIVDGENVIVDAAALAGYKVTAKVLDQFKGEKIYVVKFHKRKNYKRRNGHRQLQTRIEILSIGPAKAKSARKSTKKAAPAEVEAAPAEVEAEPAPAPADATEE